MRIVGHYIEKFNIATDQMIPCGPIYQSDGLRIHVQKHHPDTTELIDLIPDVIQFPDFIGRHPKEANSIELVKILERNVMVCIKLDLKRDYLYVASVFPISEGKLKNRIASGRLTAY